MEISDVRRRLRGAIEEARKRAAERRARNDDASLSYAAFLSTVAIPAFHALAQALVGEGHRFKVFTPGEAVRLVPEFSQDDYLELSLDTEGDRPAAMLRTSRGRGRRNIVTERAVFEGRPFAEITDEDVVAAVLEDILPFVER